jgi:glycosyltransferase involved in cell wall biosynthesis
MMLYRLLSTISPIDFESHVITLSEIGHIGKKIQRLGVSVSSLQMRRHRPNPLSLLRLARMIRIKQPDIIQTWLYHADFLGLFVSIISGRPKLLWNIRCSRVPFKNYRPLTGLMVKACSRLSSIPDAIIVNSMAGISEHIRHGYLSSRMHLIPNGINTQHFRPDPEARSSVRRELGISNDVMIIGNVARWDPLKDHSTFIRAAAQIVQDYEKVYFLLAGDGITYETQELSSLIEGSGLKKRMVLLGPRNDIHKITAAFDIACSSSVTEGFPTTVGEAMACGIPCVVSDVGDSATIVGESGRVVPPGDPFALSIACRDLIEMGDARRRELGRKARELIASKYELTSVVKEYEKLYTNLLSEGNEVRPCRVS